MKNLGSDLVYLGVQLTKASRIEKPSASVPKSALTTGAVVGYPEGTCDSGQAKGENSFTADLAFSSLQLSHVFSCVDSVR